MAERRPTRRVKNCRAAAQRGSGRLYSYRYTSDDLQRLKTMVKSLSAEEALVFFNNISMAEDAAAFQRLVG